MIDIKIPGKRVLNIAGFVVCAGMMAFALYVQHQLLLEPCPLCIFQRLAVIGIGIVFLIAALHDSSGAGRLVYSGLLFVIGASGAAVAGRHMWLQSHPEEQVQACGPGLDYMWQNFAFSDVLNKVFQGTGECDKIVWQFLGLSMPTWVLICIVGMTGVGIWNFLRKAG